MAGALDSCPVYTSYCDEFLEITYLINSSKQDTEEILLSDTRIEVRRETESLIICR